MSERSSGSPRSRILSYAGVLAACFLVGMLASWTPFASQLDNYAYDHLLRASPPAPWTPKSILLAIDEETFAAGHGTSHLRSILASGLEAIAPAKPKAVAVDIILHDDQGNPEEEARLASAFEHTKNLVLDCEMVNGHWEDPLPQFRRWAASLGHVHPDPEGGDGISRRVPLELVAARERRWALSIEAFRLERGASQILESPDDLQVASAVIPAARPVRMLQIRYLPAGIPAVSVKQLLDKPSLAAEFHDKVVFVGVTAMSGVRDRMVSPFGDPLPGVEVHAQAFETLERGVFLNPASNLNVLAFCALLSVAVGLIFRLRTGWQAYGIAACLLAVAHAVPFAMFRADIVFPTFAPVAVAWLSVAGAASFQHFVVRRQLGQSESERKRYQQAIHFVTHEMKTPLTAIQGSSELMGRYNLNEQQRRQFAEMINSESKRLARMIQTFLDVERLSDGQMELKKEPFAAEEVVQACVERIKPLAERKRIAVNAQSKVDGVVVGDRELMEYAFYNLLTNAVKYSPTDTAICIESSLNFGHLRLSVRDQGMGMDAKELGHIFQRFYRTKTAESSAEQGTGIGLSIVDQIVTHHGGKIEVESSPGHGSCFTIVVAAHAQTAVPRE